MNNWVSYKLARAVKSGLSAAHGLRKGEKRKVKVEKKKKIGEVGGEVK